jgi:uncharacterized protein (DUF4415 family)
MAKSDIRRYSLDELQAKLDRGETRTDPNAPTYELPESFWAKARLVTPSSGKTSVHLRVDSDILEWFKAQGRGHLTRMNAALRAHMEAEKKRRRAG